MRLTKFIPKVPKKVLLLLASLIWGFAGYKILHIGIGALLVSPYFPFINILISISIFGLFFKFIFLKMLKKHNQR